MENIKKKDRLIIWIFFAVLIFRLFFIFQGDSFSNDESYFYLRNIEHMNEHGNLMYHDELSFGGRDLIYTPGFYYILWFFNLFIPLILVLKLIPNIAISFLVIIVYLIAKELTNDRKAALFSALISGFIPLLIKETLNSVNVYSVILPMVFYMFYCLMRINERKYVITFVVLSFILPLIHQSAFIFVFSLLFYAILIYTETIKMDKLRKEAIIFSLILILLIEFLLFKSAFLEHGINILRGNIPLSLIPVYFGGLDMLSIIINVGILSLVLGAIGVFYGLFRYRNQNTLLFGAVILSMLLLFLLKRIDLISGMILLGVTLSILSSIMIRRFFDHLEITKLYKIKKYTVVWILIVIFVFSIFPSFIAARDEKIISHEEIDFLKWVEENTENNVTILANVNEGNLINTIAKRKSFIDSNFLLIPDIDKKISDLEMMYTTGSEAIALSLFREHDVNYIYFTYRTKKMFNTNKIRYINNKLCFKKIDGDDNFELYEITC